MIAKSLFQRAVVASVLGSAASALVVACADDAGEGSASGADAGSGARADASTGAGDAASARDAGKDANGPGEAGAPCSFNRDCQAALRCQCEESAGCACAPGPRGAGQNGLDTCDSGDQCASAVCVEGSDGEFYCSDECADFTECRPKLPVCLDVAFVGRICVRDGGS